jgi:lycopene beta-cyclase
VREVTREETGVLRVVLSGDIDAIWNDPAGRVPRAGMRAGLFHPTTGYSLPEAARLADEMCRVEALDSDRLFDLGHRRAREKWRRDGFFRMLNRMMFRAAEPERRYRILERFYRLPEPLIRRFYAGCPSRADRVRILLGKPPVPLSRALRCVREPAPPRAVRPAGQEGRG